MIRRNRRYVVKVIATIARAINGHTSRLSLAATLAFSSNAINTVTAAISLGLPLSTGENTLAIAVTMRIWPCWTGGTGKPSWNGGFRNGGPASSGRRTFSFHSFDSTSWNTLTSEGGGLFISSDG